MCSEKYALSTILNDVSCEITATLSGTTNESPSFKKRHVRKRNSKFINILWMILNECNYDTIIRWTNDGKSFVILNTQLFEKTILPHYFSHNKFQSFQRQLHYYEFFRINKRGGSIFYKHEHFQRDHPNLRHKIFRYKNNYTTFKQKSPTTSKVDTPSHNKLTTLANIAHSNEKSLKYNEPKTQKIETLDEMFKNMPTDCVFRNSKRKGQDYKVQYINKPKRSYNDLLTLLQSTRPKKKPQCQ